MRHFCLAHPWLSLLQDCKMWPFLQANFIFILICSFTVLGGAEQTDEDRQQYVNLHNQLRSGVDPSATNMRKMEFNLTLETLAKAWAVRCEFDHGQPENNLGVAIGQNLYWTSDPNNLIINAVQAFYDEIADFTFSNNTCAEDKVCGHFTQVVWADSYQVGCDVSPKCADDGYIVVCNYLPAGNFNKQLPYKDGNPCTNCGIGWGGGCENNLCTRDVLHDVQITTPFKDIQVDETPDIIPAEATPDTIPAETTPDTIPAEATPEAIPAEATPDTIPAEATPDTIPAEATPDTIPAEATPDTIPAEATPDTIPAEAIPDTIPAETTPDTITVEATPDTIPAEATPDIIPAEATPDTISAETTPDTISAETKPDSIPTEATLDTIPAETTPDTIPAEATPDAIPAEEKPYTIVAEKIPNSIPVAVLPCTEDCSLFESFLKLLKIFDLYDTFVGNIHK